MDFTIFREYDIRGVVGTQFNPEEMYDFAQALLQYLLEKNPKTSTITIGMDGRISSPEIKLHLIKSICDAGLDVLDLGVCTTPAFYFSLHTQASQTGVMITASHNPKEYNGLKICLDKESVYGADLQIIAQYLQTKKFYSNKTGIQGTHHSFDIITPYVSYLSDAFAHLKKMDLAAVFDCGNAAGGAVMPALVKAMEWENVTLLHQTVDGTFPNHEADPTEPENMKDVAQELATKPYLEVGIGLDGDADRMSPMTPSGKLIPGDQMLALYSTYVLKSHPKSSIICDIKCSDGVAEVIQAHGGTALMIPSGHTFIKAAMKQENVFLAGELSCHFFFKDRYFGFDDGIYAALRLLEILNNTDQSFDDLISMFPKKISTHEIRLACPEHEKKEIINDVTKMFAARTDSKLITVDGVRAHMSYGWGLLRASNTQPLVCLRFESETQEGLDQIKKDFVTALTPHFPFEELKEKIEL